MGLQELATRPESRARYGAFRYHSAGVPTVFLEGLDDKKFWEKFLPEKRLKCVPTNGKGPAVEAVRHAMKTSPKPGRAFCLAIVDLDYEPILRGEQPDPPGICRIQYHEGEGRCRDLEVLLVRSEALSRLLTEYPSERWEGRNAERTQWVRGRLAHCGAVVGAVHVVASFEKRERGGVTVSDNLPLEDWLDAREISLRDGYLQKVFERPEARRWRDRHGKLLQERSRWELCRGHDLTQMLAIHLSKETGRRVHPLEIERGLRLGLEAEELRRTPTWQRIRNWAQSLGIDL